MRFTLIVLAFAAAFAAATPDEAFMDELSPEYCPGGDGNTCCPKGYFSVCSRTEHTELR